MVTEFVPKMAISCLPSMYIKAIFISNLLFAKGHEDVLKSRTLITCIYNALGIMQQQRALSNVNGTGSCGSKILKENM